MIKENFKKPIVDLFESSLKVTGISRLKQRLSNATNNPPGIDHFENLDTPPVDSSIAIECIDYGGDQIKSWKSSSIEELAAYTKPEWSTGRWVNVTGLHPFVVAKLSEMYGFHPLVSEDILNPNQRSKVETYDNSLFVVMRMLRYEADHLINEQVSFIFTGELLITIQEKPGDVWGGVRKRLQKSSSRFRRFGNSYLLYALLDAIVDHFFPLLEAYGATIDQLEADIIRDYNSDMQRSIHGIKRELIYLRQIMRPVRDVVSALYHDENDFLPEEVETYLRDVYDHSIQVIDNIEVYRDMANQLHDLYNSSVSLRTNEIMKVLTILASIFIPITFLAGIYGMNFEHIPELKWKYGYPAFWGLCALTAGGLLLYFKYKGWLKK